MATYTGEAEREAGAGGTQSAEGPPAGVVSTVSGRLAGLAPPLLVVGLALALRLAGLDHPERMYFDEVYYVEDARWLLANGVEDGFVAHPQLGKWLIALGIALVGDDPVGWRLPSALAGTLMVGLVYVAGLRLLRSRALAALAALLVAVDGLAITMSRIAMLDGFMALFVVAAFALLLFERGPSGEGRAPVFGIPAARWGVGLLLGLAVATKWPGVLALGAAGLVVLVSDLTRRRHATGRLLHRPGALAAGVLLPLLAVPAAVYLVSYASWFTNFADTRPGQAACDTEPCPVTVGERLSAWAGEQAAIARFHATLDADHPYRSSAATWPLMTRPVVHYFESCPADRDPAAGPCEVAEDRAALIHGMANPVLWWSALLAYPFLAWLAVRRDAPAGWLVAFVLAQYLPWLGAGRPVFFFYSTPIVPFAALALVLAIGRIPRAWRAPLGALLAAGAVAAAAFWYPVWTGAELPDEAWRARMLLRSWY